VQAFKDKDHENARSLLFQAIEAYFRGGWDAKDESKLRLTSLAPIYFQHRGMILLSEGFTRANVMKGTL
jgi:hypothetical protein